MTDCWQISPNDRPTFSQVRKNLEDIVADNKVTNEIKPFPLIQLAEHLYVHVLFHIFGKAETTSNGCHSRIFFESKAYNYIYFLYSCCTIK